MLNLILFEGEVAPDIAGILTTASTSAAGQITTAITTVVPVALGLMGLVMAIKVGISVFKSTSNKAAK